MWRAFVSWMRRLLGLNPASPRQQIEAWMRELQDRMPTLDNAVARLRAEVAGATHLLQQLDQHLNSVEQEIETSLAKNDRTHAASLALERQQLLARRPARVESAERTQQELAYAIRIRDAFLTAQTAEVRRFKELLRQEQSSQLIAAVAEIHATYATAGRPTLSDQLLEEATTRADADRARLRVAADLARPEQLVPLAGVHSEAAVDDPPLLTHSS